MNENNTIIVEEANEIVVSTAPARYGALVGSNSDRGFDINFLNENPEVVNLMVSNISSTEDMSILVAALFKEGFSFAKNTETFKEIMEFYNFDDNLEDMFDVIEKIEVSYIDHDKFKHKEFVLETIRDRIETIENPFPVLQTSFEDDDDSEFPIHAMEG